MDALRYEASIAVTQCDSSYSYLEGALYNLSNHAQIVYDRAPEGYLSVAVRGEKNNGHIVFEERANLSDQIMSPSEVFKFKMKIEHEFLKICNKLTVALVREGERWLISEGIGVHYNVRKITSSEKFFLEPLEQYEDQMFQGSDYVKVMYSGYYLNLIAIKYGVPVALDFAWNYFFKRNIDLSGYQSASASILQGSNLFSKLCLDLYGSEECKARLKQAALGNPYNEIGKWEYLEETLKSTVLLKENAE